MAIATEAPRVIVRQEFAELTPVLARPILPPVAIGLAFQIEEKKFAAVYTGAAIVLTYPDLKPGALVQTLETVVELVTVEDRFTITNVSGVVITDTQITIPANLIPEKDIITQRKVSTEAGTELTDSNSNFFTDAVRTGDIVRFIIDESDLVEIKTNASNQPGDYVIISVLSPTELELSGRVPANHVVATTENYTIGSGTTDTVGLDVDELGSFTVVLTSGTRSAQQVVDDLNADSTFAARATADVFNDKLRIASKTLGPTSSIEFQANIAQSAHAALGLGEAAEIIGTVVEPFDIETNGDDRMKFRINDVDITEIQLTPGTDRTAAQIAADLNDDAAFAAEATAFDEGGKLRITSDKKVDSIIEVQTTLYGTGAYDTLGLTTGTFLGTAKGSNSAALIKEDNIEYKVIRKGAASGDIEVSYRAQRTDLKGQLFEFGIKSALEANLGKAVPTNPLSFGMNLMIQNTDLTVLGTAVDADTPGEFQEALEFLQTIDVWGIVPLTQNETVFQLVKQHVNELSDPLEGLEREAFINPVIKIFETRQADRSLTTDPVGTVPSEEWTDSGALFDTNGVVPGDLLRITALVGTIEIDGVDQGTASTTSPIDLQVLEVLSETEVRIAGEFTSNTSITSVTYEVRTKDFSKFELARNIRDFAQTFADRRVIVTHPDEVELDVDGTLTLVPGYFAAASAAGQRSALRPAQGQSTLPLVGFTGLRRSNGFFSKAQLDTIASGGVWVFQQRQEGAPIATRRQLTSDVSALEKAELTVTVVADFTAKYLRFQINPLLGRNNISKRFIERQLRPQIEAVLRDLKEDENIGEDSRILSLGQDPNNKTSVISRIDLKVPPPFNEADITLVIAFSEVTT